MIPAFSRRMAALSLCALAASLALAACDGSNGWVGPVGTDTTGTGGGAADRTAPTVDMTFPTDSTTQAVGDSVFVRARVQDNVMLDSVVFTGFAPRGSPDLGTQTAVPRFQRKAVSLRGLSHAVRDTVLSRYLLAVPGDTTTERDVRVVVTAYDTAGNLKADTAHINLGGPRVSITSPAPGATFAGGTQIAVRLEAEDRVDQIRSIRLRATGAFSFDSTLTLRVPATLVDTVVVVPLPNVQGALQLSATATSGSNLPGNSRPIDVVVTAPSVDKTPPAATFTASFPERAEPGDSLVVVVTGTDEVRVDSVGVTILAIHRTATREDTLAVLQRRVRASADSARFSLSQVPLSGLDTVNLSLEVTAYAIDPSHNCGAATSLGTPQSLPCAPGPQGSRVAQVPGRLFNVFIARGLTVARPNAGDVIADLVADSTRLYLSNLTRNRVEVLPIGSRTYSAPVRVGSEPWGLAISRGRDTLFVANSGGTNISAIPLKTPTLAEAEGARIFTRNELLYDVTFSVDADTKVASPGSVVAVDYSDRPQFIAQASNGFLVFSTKPTGAAPDGTVRLYDSRRQDSEIYVGYAPRSYANKAIVVNAASAGLVVGKPNLLSVCARDRRGDPPGSGPCFTDGVDVVAHKLDSLRALPANADSVRYDTRVDLFRSITDVGLRDTTFVAVSGDRNYIAVGEGTVQRARVPMFRSYPDSLVQVGDVRDLISNTNERVIGLSLNYDGSLGVARGNQAYFFNNQLRLQGVTPSGSPAGGVAMHPDNRAYPSAATPRRSFVSGIDEAGAPYIDIIDTFNFFRVSRIYLRDPVVGALTVAPRVAGDPANVVLRLYAITSRGVVGVTVTSADMGS